MEWFWVFEKSGSSENRMFDEKKKERFDRTLRFYRRLARPEQRNKVFIIVDCILYVLKLFRGCRDNRPL